MNAQFVGDLRFCFGHVAVEKYHSTDVVFDGLTQLLGVLQQVGGISDVDESDGDRLDVVVDDLTQPTRSADFRTKPVLHLNEIIDENYVTGTIFGWEAAYDDVTSTCLLRQHLAVSRGEHCPRLLREASADIAASGNIGITEETKRGIVRLVG